MTLCKYKDIFGAPGEGAHSYRFMGLAIVDVVLTIAAGLLIAWIMNWSMWQTVAALFALGIIMHRMFCVRSTIDKLLFP